MKKLNVVFLCLTVLVPLGTSPVFALEAGVSEEASEEVRTLAAREKLGKEASSVILYAKGLCCPSCAIGVRKLVSKLDFVDRERFNKGVELDTKTQLVTVAIKESEAVDLKSLSEAVLDAGYDPVRSYRLDDGNLLTEPLAADS
jgi:copper chaperone CopZ